MAMCIYTNCTSAQKPFSSLAFFALPKDHRRSLWIENSGNQELKTLSETARRVVCQLHFRPSLLRTQFHRTTLSRDAVPERWDADKCYNSINDRRAEPIEIIDSNDAVDATQSHELLTDNDGADDDNDARHDINEWGVNYENNSEEQAEVIEFVEIDHDEHLEQAIDECADDNIEIDQCDQNNDEEARTSNQFSPSLHEVEINTADSGLRETMPFGKSSTFEIVHQNPTTPPVERHESENVQCKGQSIDVSVSSSTSKSDNVSGITSEEDKYFALAVVGILQRISPQKKAFAKVNILRYLTELEYGVEATIN